MQAQLPSAVFLAWVSKQVVVAGGGTLSVYDASDNAHIVARGRLQTEADWLVSAGPSRCLIGRAGEVALVDLSDANVPFIVATRPDWLLGYDPVVELEHGLVTFLDGNLVTVASLDDLEPFGTLALTTGDAEHLRAYDGMLVASGINGGWADIPAQCTSTGLGNEVAPAPVLVLAASPNPFNPRVTFSFRMPATGPARFTIHDLAGRRIAVLHAGPLASGLQTWSWDGTDAGGAAAPSGVYFARLQAAGRTAVVKVTLVQ